MELFGWIDGYDRIGWWCFSDIFMYHIKVLFVYTPTLKFHFSEFLRMGLERREELGLGLGYGAVHDMAWCVVVVPGGEERRITWDWTHACIYRRCSRDMLIWIWFVGWVERVRTCEDIQGV